MSSPEPEEEYGAAADLHAYLGYEDIAAALDWLAAVGFRLVARQDSADGEMVHGEVRLGSVVLMITGDEVGHGRPALRDSSTGGGLYLCLPTSAAVDQWFFRAVAAGGTPVIEPEETPWGARRARVLDPEGHEWSVGTYRPG
ncbi:VOC family protein [Streptomyces sp. NPDC058745]|uniref:VOC family protein n=1 Tax=unclassified Streptomyces TaxID=2593676 RepID=UPI00369592D8